MTIIAFCNWKGGVGKTTLVFHLLRALARQEKKALGIDLDPQGNLTRVLAEVPLEHGDLGVADALSLRTPETLESVIVPSVWKEWIDLAPTAPGTLLQKVRDELFLSSGGNNRFEGRLRDLLLALPESKYDYVLIDCPPSLDYLTTSAFTAADEAAIVAESELFSNMGLVEIFHSIATVQRFFNPSLTIAGIIVNKLRSETTGHRYAMDELAEFAQRNQIKLFNTRVPYRRAIEDSRIQALGLDEYRTEHSKTYPELVTVFDDLLSEMIGGEPNG
ncbi:MAG: AAA family ATPase [Propionibacteriaceae bacterium]|jgi:chromosome partitioning protein|nr:AAA family ATPase [Propionibacteriaceae bacterium]